MEEITSTEKTIMIQKTIEIKIMEENFGDYFEITFWENGQQLKNVGFNLKKDEYRNRFLLRRMYSPYPGRQLGEFAIRLFLKAVPNATIWTRENDGVQQNDGSHLTEGAPDFVRKMQKLGLIEEWPDFNN